MPALDADVARNLCLAVPLAAVAAAAWLRAADGSLPARIPGAFLATAYAWVAVLAFEQVQPWWTFAPTPTDLAAVPAEVSLGWALAWGALPALAGGLPLVWLLGLAWVDSLTMPALGPLVELGPDWLAGEAAVLALVAAPALALGRATTARSHLWFRVGAQVVTYAGLFGWLVPMLALRADGRSWADVVDHSYPVRSGLLVLATAFATTAAAAVVELARAGGTPFPWDPPQRLVTTGPYAYLANPMQLATCALVGLLAIAGGSWRLAAAGGFALAFSTVLAERHERATLTARWAGYADYRAHVRAWWPRWRPYVPAPRTLWFARSCPLCSATGAALAAMAPTGLACRAAEESPVALRRMRWEGDEMRSDGVAAFARALEHTTLPWAWLGWWMRLPGVDRVLQLVADACGLGPRDLAPAGAGAGTERGAR